MLGPQSLFLLHGQAIAVWNCHTGVAAPSGVSVYLPILPSSEGSLEETGHEHQCAIWVGVVAEKIESSVHPVQEILRSPRFQTGLNYGTSSILWVAIQNQDSKRARCYVCYGPRQTDALFAALRQLGVNIQEPHTAPSPYRCISMHPFKGKPAPRRTAALRAPWSFTPNQQLLQGFLRPWHLRVLSHQVPCLNPSFKMVFVKHCSVMDLLCNQKGTIEAWSTGDTPKCYCSNWQQGHSQPSGGPLGPVWIPACFHAPSQAGHLSRRFSHEQSAPFQEGLSVPPLRRCSTLDQSQRLTIHSQKPDSRIVPTTLAQHFQAVTSRITKSSIDTLRFAFSGAVFHCEDKDASSLRLFCPCLYYQAIEKTFLFEPIPVTAPDYPHRC